MDSLPIEPDCVIHLAWYTVPGKYLDAPENNECLEASRRLLKKLKCRAIFAGTCFEYDTQLGRLNEKSKTNPLTLYSICKNNLSNMVIQRPNSTWLRLFYQYGPREDPRRQIPSVIRNLLEGTEVKLSPGEQQKDFLHVDDIAQAIVTVAESKLEGPVNVGSSQAVTQRRMLSLLANLARRPDLLKFGEIPYYPNEPMLIEADNTLLRSTGWTPKWSLEAGLRNTFDWWRTVLK
jgi:nucleoside-diphosphate-sugar epimerase